MYNLLLNAILADQADMIQELADAQWYYGTTFCLINMLVGVLCEVACRVSAAEKEKMDIEMLSTKLEWLLATCIDKNGDHLISKKEFLSITDNYVFVKALRQVGVDEKDLKDHADFIF